MILNCTWLYVIVAEDLTICKVYVSIKNAGTNNNIPIKEHKSIDGVMNLDYTQSVEQQRLGEILSKPRIQWSKGN